MKFTNFCTTNNNKLNQNKPNRGFIKNQLYCLGFIAFLVSTVVLTIQSASSGAKLKMLEEEEIRLTRGNQRLLTGLAEHTSLIQIESKAEELGFIKPENTFYIKGAESVAKLP